jgi:hypothetical protein
MSAHALIGTMHRMNIQNVDSPQHFARMLLHPVLLAPSLSRRVTARAGRDHALMMCATLGADAGWMPPARLQ